MLEQSFSIQNKYTLYKSNLAISISNNLTSVERKFFNQIINIAQIDLSQSIYALPANYFSCLIGKSKRRSYQEIANIFDRLISKVINLINPTDIKFNKSSYVSSARLENDIIYFELSNALKEAICINLLNKEGNKSINSYTKFNLNIINQLNSTHSIALYELAKSRIFATKEINININTLRNMICSNTNYYQDFKKFNQKVLQKAIKEINEKTDTKIVVCETIKGYDNKTIEKIRFIVEKQNDNPILVKNLEAKQTKLKSKSIQISKPIVNEDIISNVNAIELDEQYSDIDTTQLLEVKPSIENEYPTLVNQLQKIGIKPLSKILKWHAQDKELLQAIYDEVIKKYANKKDVEKQRLIASMFQNKINPNFISPTEKLANEQKKQQDAIQQEKNRKHYEEAEAKRIAKQQLIEEEAKQFNQELDNKDSQISRIWHRFIKLANVPDNQKTTWIDPLTAQFENENTLKIIAPNSIKADFFRKQLSNHIEQAVRELHLNYKIQVSSY